MNQSKPSSRPAAAEGRLFFFGMFGLLALLTILVVFPFLNIIGLAIVLVLVLQPLYRFFLRYTWLQQHPGWALALTLISATLIVLIPLYLFLSIAFIDNVLCPMLVPKEAYLSPALVLLSVLGGIQLMGLLGAFYGPVIMILLATTFEVYTTYYAADTTSASSPDDEGAPSPIGAQSTAQR